MISVTATAMIALVFLYWLAAIFLYGAELNAALMEARTSRQNPRPFLSV